MTFSFSDINLEFSACPNGCVGTDKTLFSARDRLHDLPGEFTIVRCGTCGLIRTNPRPTASSIGLYYPEDYGPYHGTRIRSARQGARPFWKRLLRPVYQSVFRFNTNALPPLPPGRMLEVGCASGAFLAQMAEEGWQIEGIEFSEQAASHARSAGFKVHSGALEAAPEPQAPYDLVVGWMVIEHLHDPLASLAKMARWTRPGGWLAISVPNAGALDFRLFKGAGYALQVPTHLHHFTPQTLSLLLEKGGWRAEKIFHQRLLSNLFGSIGYMLEDVRAPQGLVRFFKDYPQKAGRWHTILYPLAWALAIFGQTGRMTVWARKKEIA